MIQTAIQFRFFLVHRVHLGDGADIVEKSVRGDGECEQICCLATGKQLIF